MMRIADIPIARRLAAAVTLPLLVAIGFGAATIYDGWMRTSHSERMQSIMALAPALGDVIHQVQTERGLTNTMLRNASDQAVAQARRTQMERVDAAVSNYRRTVEALKLSLGDRTSGLDGALGRLAGLRTEVDARRIAAPDAVAAYTQIVDAAMAPVEALTRDDASAGVIRTLVTYASVLRAKEAAGLERATGAGAFRANGFEAATYPRFLALGAAQESLLGVARRFALPEHATALADFSRAATEAPVVDLRARAARAVFQSEAGVEPLVWFRASTARMDALKVIEDRIVADLVGMVDAGANASRAAMVRDSAIVVAMLVLVVLLGVGIARSITRPIARLTDDMRQLSTGDISIAVAGSDRRDEIGDMARAVLVFRDNAIERSKLENAAAHTHTKEQARQKHMEALLARFKSDAVAIVESLARETRSMRGAAGTLSEAAATVTAQSNEARATSSAASTSARTVADAAGGLGASIRDIAAKAQQASMIVERTTAQAQRTNDDVASLVEGADRIGAVVQIIRTIADQTNLLALNATIEAARSGEAGRGFAVVASEVKALASQTAKATEDIATQIAAMQTATTNAAASIRAIAEQIAAISTETAAITRAVESQDAATGEIVQNVARSAEGSQQVAANVDAVTSAAGRASGETQRVSSIADEVGGATERLSTSVEEFVKAFEQDLNDRRKSIRIVVDQPATLSVDGRSMSVRINEIGVGGVRLRNAGGLAGLSVGTRLTVDFGEGAVASTVAWVSGEGVGIGFDVILTRLPAFAEASRAAA